MTTATGATASADSGPGGGARGSGAGRAHAVVVGAGLAGLMAARVLADPFDRVTVVDRDDLPEGPEPRSGHPDVSHAHSLLPRGHEVLDGLFPGLSRELVGAGALTGAVRVLGPDRRTAWLADPGTLGLGALTVGRPVLEGAVRSRVRALGAVRLLDRTAVLDLVVVGGRVTGVRVADRDEPGSGRTVPADLVVDASGQGSRLPAWLMRFGFAPPVEHRVRHDTCSVGLRLPRSPQAGSDVVVVGVPSPERARGTVLLARGDGLWAAWVSGRHGDRPPADADALAADLRADVDPGVSDLVGDGAVPGGTGCHRSPAVVRRRYERLARLPRGLLVVGDALCSTDPVSGQGTTVAALQVAELAAALADGPDADVGRRFLRAAARQVDAPWRLAVGTPAGTGVPA